MNVGICDWTIIISSSSASTSCNFQKLSVSLSINQLFNSYLNFCWLSSLYQSAISNFCCCKPYSIWILIPLSQAIASSYGIESIMASPMKGKEIVIFALNSVQLSPLWLVERFSYYSIITPAIMCSNRDGPSSVNL